MAPTLRTLTVAALLYSALHFCASGVRQPFDHPNLGKIDEHAAPLREHLRTGAPVHIVHPAQYGPVFFFVVHPLLRTEVDDAALSAWLYGLQLLCIAAAFLLTCAALRPLMVARRDRWPLAVAWLAVLWLNFSPLYTVLALKSVETWELCLIALALYAHLRRGPGGEGAWPWIAALAISAAGLIKVLPFVFLYYWLVTDRRTFARAALAVAALLAVSQLLYGRDMGARYLPHIVAGASSYGVDWHENISLKAALARLLGRLPAPTTDASRTSGYVIELAGWRRTAVSIAGDAFAIAGLAALTWSWMRADRGRSHRRVLNEWSLLAVAVLILSPNTIFEYATLALGAVSYAFVALAAAPRRDARAIAAFTASLLLLGGILPRQWLNRVSAVDLLNRWTGHLHLMPSESYQYYGFPLAGLILLAATIWRLQPAPDAA